MKRIRLVRADDPQAVREGLRLLLDSQPDRRVVGEAATAAAPAGPVRSPKPKPVQPLASIGESNTHVPRDIAPAPAAVPAALPSQSDVSALPAPTSPLSPRWARHKDSHLEGKRP